MQNLDEFRVSNFTKKKLKDQLDIKNLQIYSFVPHRDQQPAMTQVTMSSGETAQLRQALTMEHQLLVEKPVVASMAETNHCNFEARVLEALQVFAEAEFQNDILMPTTSFQPVCLKDKAFQEYVKNDQNFKQLYTGATNDKSLEQTNENSGPIQPSSLMLVENSYDHRVEKLKILEKKQRKVYTSVESIYEIQDMYLLNETEQHKLQSSNQTTLGRATYNRDMKPSKLRVYLEPNVFSHIFVEQQCISQQNKLKDFFTPVLRMFKHVPYASAKFFYQIATNGLHYKPERIVRADIQNQSDDLGSQKKVDWNQFYSEDGDDVTNTMVQWGEFLPQKVQSLLLNMSRYLFDDLLSTENCDQVIANKSFLGACKVFIQSTPENELFESSAPLRMQWNFLQVMKVLYEGQARSNKAMQTLNKIFEPVYASIGINLLRQKLAKISESDQNGSILAQKLTNQDESDIVDELRNKLFSDNANYSFSSRQETSPQISEELSFASIIQPAEVEDNKDTIDFHQAEMPRELERDMLRLTSRVMPKPVLDYEKDLLEPLTSVFADFQAEYNKQNFDENVNLKSLPCCTEFKFEVISSNMLLADIYSPKNRIDYEHLSLQEVQQLRPEQKAKEFQELMTAKVIEVCSAVMASLFQHKAEIPFSLKYIIRVMIDKNRMNLIAPIEDDEAHLIGDFFAGVWLSNAFRWPESLGMTPAFSEEALTLGHLLVACRLVIETALTCQELPFPSQGHRTYSISKLNQWIRRQKRNVLQFYTSILISLDMSSVQVVSFEQSKLKSSGAHEPTELFEASLFRVNDMKILAKLMLWQTQSQKSFQSSFEESLDFCHKDKGMIKDLSSDQIREYVEEARSTQKVFSSSFTSFQQASIDFWTEKNLELYEQLHQKTKSTVFSFDLEWSIVGQFYLTLLKDENIKFLLSNDSGRSLQSDKFRVYRDAESTLQIKKRHKLAFQDEVFEDQFIAFYEFEKEKDLINRIGDEKKKSLRKQLWAYVEQHYNTNSTHEQLHDPRKVLLPGQKLKKKISSELESVEEEKSESSFLDSSRVDDPSHGPLTEIDETETERDDDSPDESLRSLSALSCALQQSDHTSSSMYSQPIHQVDERRSQKPSVTRSLDTKQMKQFMQAQRTTVQPSGINVPSENEIKTDRTLKTKMQYVDAITRVFYHLKGALSQPNFITERITNKMLAARGISLLDAANGPYIDTQLNLEKLFSQVLLDDRGQPDSSMQLQLDAFLIKRYFTKLDPLMQENLMELLKQRSIFVTKMMDLNFEKKHHKFDRVLKFIKTLQQSSTKRQSKADLNFNALKVNRFICKSWSQSVTISHDELSKIIKQVYQDGVLAMKQFHHNTEIIAGDGSSSISVSSLRLAMTQTTDQQVHQSAAAQAQAQVQAEESKQGSSNQSASLLHLQSKATAADGFLEEQSQLDHVQAQIAFSQSMSEDSRQSMQVHYLQQRKSMFTEKSQPKTGSTSQQVVKLEIKTLSSNLIYAVTVLNQDFVRQQVLSVDLESHIALASIMDASDDQFLIYDLYKIYLSCIKRVFISPTQAQDKETQTRNQDFLLQIQSDLFEQLIERIWVSLNDDDKVLAKDELLRNHFVNRGKAKIGTSIQNDMDLLDLSDSESDQEDGNGLISESGDSYEVAIQTLISIGSFNSFVKKAEIIERSILMAMRAYKQTMSITLNAASKEVSAEVLTQLMEHLVAQCYIRDPKFCLHLSLVFLVVILSKQNNITSSIMSLSQYVGSLYKSLSPDIPK